MKQILIRFLMAAAMTVVACALASSVRAQQADEDPSPTSPRQPESPSTQAPSQQQGVPNGQASEPQTQNALAFTGIVSRVKDQIVLHDPVTKIVYKLDDPAKAHPYLGKQVKVVGTLGMNSNTIHITSIEAIPEGAHE